MATQTQTNIIHVPALMDGEKVVVPQFWLGKNVEYKRDSKGNALSDAEYNFQMMLSTLAELRHAFFGGSKYYRQSVLGKRGYGEWTSTFLQNGKYVVENPENVVCRNGVWVLEGGKATPVKLPPDGWTLEYDKPTGFPSRTTHNREDAEKVFGNGTSYFNATRSGTRVVLRYFSLSDDGPFYVNADCGPGVRNPDIGGRERHRSEQAAKQLAPPVEWR